MKRRSKKGPRARRRALLAIKKGELGALADGALVLVPGVDGRTKVARRARRIRESLFEELGGAKGMPEWKKQLIQRVAFASISCEVLETKMLHGEPCDHELHTKCVRTLDTMLKRLGIDPARAAAARIIADDEGELEVIERIIIDIERVQS
jgi:hypothetical protein